MAETVYQGGPIESVGSWDNGLPDTSGNVGTGAITDDLPATTDSFFIVQTGGTINSSNADRGLTNGSWTVDDGTWTIRDLDPGGTQDFIVNGGSISARSIDHTGDLVQINGGTVTLSRNLFNNGASVEINGGIVDMTGSGFGFLNNTNDFVINGGTITITDYFGFSGGSSIYTFGMGSGGSVTADRFNGAGNLNWLTGSQMSLTITSADEWAESAWNSGNLTYNGLGNTTIGGSGATWAQVTAAGGLDGTYSFSYDSLTESLSLSVVPEPSTAALLFGCFAGLTLLRRKRL